MIHHSWKKLDSLPLIFVVVFAIGVFVPCIIALSNGHATPYVPYISEGGAEFPEAGIFSIFISLSAFLCLWIILMRYLIVEEVNAVLGNEMNTFLNKISFALGSFSSFALIVVASYPTSTVAQVHNSAAGSSCVCFVIYLVCHTWISFKMMGSTKMSYCRLALTIVSVLSLISITVFGLIGSSMWTADYGAGLKTPKDKGFAFYLVSSCSEWLLAFFLVLFFSTYILEFKKAILHFQVDIAATSKSGRNNLEVYQQ